MKVFYQNADNTVVGAEIDGVNYSMEASLLETRDNHIARKVAEWLDEGNTVEPYVAPPISVPAQVSPYQARIALLQAGLLSTVETLMSDPGTPAAAKIAWEYATVWERNSAFISTLGPSLNLTEGQIDDLFVAASQVT